MNVPLEHVLGVVVATLIVVWIITFLWALLVKGSDENVRRWRDGLNRAYPRYDPQEADTTPQDPEGPALS